MKVFQSLAALAGVAAARWSPGTVSKAESPLVVLYYEEWSEWVREFHVSQLDKVILSRNLPVRNWVINLAFLTWAGGDCHLAPTDEQAGWSKPDTEMGSSSWFTPKTQWGSPAGSMAGLLALKQKYPHIKILPSVGGWSASHTFSSCIRTKPDNMVQSAIDFVKYFHFDGIDLDWEYPECPGTEGRPGDCGCQKEPVCPTSSNGGAQGDWELYKSFLIKLRGAFDKLETELQRRLYITAAIGMNPKHIGGESPWTAPMPVEWICDNDYFDWINLMTYDMYGGWAKKTGHQAPLYPQPNDPDADSVQLSTSDSIERILARCKRPEKLMMGLATYGRSWAQVPPTGRIPGLWQESQNTQTDIIRDQMSYGPDGTYELGVVSFWELNNVYLKSSTCKSTWDDVAKVPSLHCATNPTTVSHSEWKQNTFITYEDGDSWAAKMDYARKKGLGGAIIWAASDFGGTTKTNDSVDKLFGGLFRGWTGSNVSIGGIEANGRYTFNKPTMQQLMDKGVDVATFPCPYLIAATETGQLVHDWKNTDVHPNPCYASDSVSYQSKTPYPLFQGSGTQDMVGKDVILIVTGTNVGGDTDPEPVGPVDPVTPGDVWSEEYCKQNAKFEFDAVTDGYCDTYCHDMTQADCPEASNIVECLRMKLPGCTKGKEAWDERLCEEYTGFADNLLKAGCIASCKEYSTLTVPIGACRKYTDLPSCFVADSPPCIDKSMDRKICKNNVPSKSVECMTLCDTIADDMEEISSCMRSGKTEIVECVISRNASCATSTGPSTDDSALTQCKSQGYPAGYGDYCKDLCDWYAYDSTDCKNYASLAECVTKLASSYCGTTGSSTGEIDTSASAVTACKAIKYPDVYQSYCEGYCDYYAYPGMASGCSTLSECVANSPGDLCKSNGGGVVQTPPGGWDEASCISHYKNDPNQTYCEGYCTYYGYPGNLEQCKTQGYQSLAACVNGLTADGYC